MKMKNVFGVLALLLIALVPLVHAEDSATDVAVAADAGAMAAADDSSVAMEADVSASAQADASNQEYLDEDPGVTPDSAFYGIASGWSRLKLALTVDKVKKAERALELADRKLLQVRKMLEEGKTREAERAQKDYDDLLRTSKESADSIDTDGSSDRAEKALARILVLQNRTEAHYAKVLAVKEAILERMKDRMTDEQYAHLQAVFDKIKNNSADVEARVEARRNAAKVKYKVLSGMNDTEVEMHERQLEKEAGLDKSRMLRARASIANAKLAIAKAKARLKVLEAEGLDADLVAELQAEIDSAEQVIIDAESSTSSGDAENAQDLSLEVKDYGNDIAAIATLLGEARKEGNFDEMKIKLKEAIDSRVDGHRAKIVQELRVRLAKVNDSRLRERVEDFAEKRADRVADRLDRRLNLTDRQEDRIERKVEQRTERRVSGRIGDRLDDDDSRNESEVEIEIEIESEDHVSGKLLRDDDDDDDNSGSGSSNSGSGSN